MPLRTVDPAAFRKQTWANGGGTTTELAAGPEPDHWHWRISLAQVDVAGPFSALPGVRRQIAPLDVALRLRFPDGRDIHLQRLQVLAFDGAPAPECELPEGPGRDINLMLRDGADGTLIVRPLVGHMVVPANPSERWFVYVAAGQATLSDGRTECALASGHAAWIEAGSGQRTIIEGAGEIVLVRLAGS